MQSLQSLVLKIKSNASGVRDVSVLVGGTAVANAITAFALPVLARLYSPAQFGTFAVFSSLISVIGVAACLRFDVAVPLPEADSTAANVLALALVCAVLVSITVAIPIVAFPAAIAGALNQTALQKYLLLVPLGIWLTGSLAALQSWFVRQKEFSAIARTRVIQSASTSSSQVSLGFAGVAPLGLLVGFIMNSASGCVLFGARLLRSGQGSLRTVTLRGMRNAANVYDRFPKYSALEALSNAAGIQVPVILIAALAARSEAGYVTMAMYVMQMPTALIGTAVAQVYLSRAPAEYRAGTLSIFTERVLGSLLNAGVGPLLFVGIIAPRAFPLLFGQQWEGAGRLVAWMTPWFILQFIASPVSMALHVTSHQRTALALQLFGLLTRVGVVLVAAKIYAAWISEAYAISGFVVYLVYLQVILTITGVSIERVGYSARASLKPILSWVVLAGAVWALLAIVSLLGPI